MSTRICTDLLAAHRSFAFYRNISYRHAGYATATVKKPKPAGNLPKVHKPVAAPTAKKLSPVKTTSPRNETSKSQPTAPTPSAAETSKQDVTKSTDRSNITPEQQLEELDRLLKMGTMFPSLDPWGGKIETLDVHLPKPDQNLFSLKPWRENFRAAFEDSKDSTMDWAKNVRSMWTMASADAFPDVKTNGKAFSRKLFNIQSTDSKEWLAPFRADALKIYRDIQLAVANGDKAALKKLAVDSYLEQKSRILSKRDPSVVFRWRFLQENSPTKVLSIRASPMNMDRGELTDRDRLVVHVLVQFDTIQSLQMFTKKGLLLDERGQRTENQSAPALPQEVKEYLVFEKRMWYNGGWVDFPH